MVNQDSPGYNWMEVFITPPSAFTWLHIIAIGFMKTTTMTTFVGKFAWRPITGETIIPPITISHLRLPLRACTWACRWKMNDWETPAVYGQVQLSPFAKTLGCCPLPETLVICGPLSTLEIFGQLYDQVGTVASSFAVSSAANRTAMSMLKAFCHLVMDWYDIWWIRWSPDPKLSPTAVDPCGGYLYS